jgi:hypothetical protein
VLQVLLCGCGCGCGCCDTHHENFLAGNKKRKKPKHWDATRCHEIRLWESWGLCPNMISKEQQMWLKWCIYSIPRWVYIILLGGGMGVEWRVVEFIPPPYNPLCIFCLPTPNKIIKEQQMLHIRVWHASHRNMILRVMRPLWVLLPKELVP